MRCEKRAQEIETCYTFLKHRFSILYASITDIATVLTELADKMDAEKLFELAEQNHEIVWKQRLGYLLEILGRQDIANSLKKHLKNKRVDYILLAPELKFKGKIKRSQDWKIIINTTIESDI